jgi:transposase
VFPTFGRFLLLALLRGHDPTADTLVPDNLWHGSPVTCWRRLRDWQRAGVWQQLHHQPLNQLGRDSKLDWSRASLDLLSVRAKRGAS